MVSREREDSEDRTDTRVDGDLARWNRMDWIGISMGGGVGRTRQRERGEGPARRGDEGRGRGGFEVAEGAGRKRKGGALTGDRPGRPSEGIRDQLQALTGTLGTHSHPQSTHRHPKQRCWARRTNQLSPAASIRPKGLTCWAGDWLPWTRLAQAGPAPCISLPLPTLPAADALTRLGSQGLPASAPTPGAWSLGTGRPVTST